MWFSDKDSRRFNFEPGPDPCQQGRREGSVPRLYQCQVIPFGVEESPESGTFPIDPA
jgi:hypothetical protein